MLKELLESMKSCEWTSSGKIGGSSEIQKSVTSFKQLLLWDFLDSSGPDVVELQSNLRQST